MTRPLQPQAIETLTQQQQPERISYEIFNNLFKRAKSMNKYIKFIKGIYTKYVVENYLNFILTVIAILLYANVIVIDDGLKGIDYEVRWLRSSNEEIASSLSSVESDLSSIAFEVKYFSEKVYEK